MLRQYVACETADSNRGANNVWSVDVCLQLQRLDERGYYYHLSRKRLDESYILVWCGIIDVLSSKCAAICVCCQASAAAEFNPSPK